jgi:glycosyltransferase involved in cell wall biosynthesis/SAM-dependent methyltransferase
MTVFCTIASRYALPHVRVLVEDLERHHPESRLVVLLLDGDAAGIADRESVETVRPHELDATRELEFGWRGWADLAVMLAPKLLELVLERGAMTAIHIEADVDVCDSLEPFTALAREHGVALLPRVPEGLPDDRLEPDDRALLAAGRVSPALIGVSAGDTGATFLRWWSTRMAESAESLQTAQPPATNLAGCARELSGWLDLAPAVFGPRIALLDDPGFGISFWNLHARRLSSAGGELLAAGAPVRCIHYSGFRPDRPYWLSTDGTRVRVLDDPLLMDLCAVYAKRLLAAGWVNPEHRSDRLGRLADGTPFDERLRRLYVGAAASGEPFGDVSTADGTDAFTAWLKEPAQRGGAQGVNRYLYDAYLERSDVQDALPDLDGADGAQLIEWAWEHGTAELGLSPVLLPPLPGSAAPVTNRGIAVSVIGYLTESLGLGEAARLYVSALRSADVPVSTAGVRVQLPVDEPQEQALARYGRQRYEHSALPYKPPFRLLCVNPDSLTALLDEEPGLVRGGYTIGQWGWETDVLPRHWLPQFDAVDEIWVYSRYVADLIGRWSPVPVVTVPLPVVKPDPGDASVDFELGDGFVFLFVFDFFSTLQRKNPDGVVEAFTRAFAPGEGPRLVLKAMNGTFRPESLDALRYKIGDRPDITLIDQHVDRPSYAALLARADCYVSLHRAEGFGLTIAESMALGKPVIATGYSANLDFMTPANSYIVDYKLTKVGPEAEHYPADGTWAEPDLDHAAALMRRVLEHPAEAQGRGARAAADVAERFSPERVGRIARARLERIAASRAAGQAGSSAGDQTASSFAEIDRALSLDPVAAGGGRSRLLRRLLLRLLRPFTYHERALDAAIVRKLKDLSAEVSNLERSHNGRAVKPNTPIGRGAERQELKVVMTNDESMSRLRDAAALIDVSLEPPPKGEIGFAKSALRKLGLRLGRAHARHQHDIDRQLLQAIEESRIAQAESETRLRELLDSRLEALQEAMQEPLARLATDLLDHRAWITGLSDRIGALEHRQAEIEPLVASNSPLHRADGLALETFDAGPAGLVVGYRDGGPASGSSQLYAGFEDYFRGPEVVVRERQRAYLALLDGRGAVLDVGCGRGELLELLRDAGIEGRGIDLDGAMVERCRQKGLEVEQADAISYLDGVSGGSLGTVFASHVIEHLPYESLVRFLSLGLSRLSPGGLLVVETINPHAPQALKQFWIDPTHQHPLFPEVVVALCRLTGFSGAYIWHPSGTGDAMYDRLYQGDYAVVAHAPAGHA